MGIEKEVKEEEEEMDKVVSKKDNYVS